MAVDVTVRGSKGPLALLQGSVAGYVLRLIGLALVDAVVLAFIYRLLRDGVWPIAIPLGVIILAVNIFVLSQRMSPLRWQVPAMIVLVLVVLFSIVYTVYSGFTNYSDGHILSKQQAIQRLGFDLYLPEGGLSYSWTAFRNDEGEYRLWFQDEEGQGLLGTASAPLETVTPGENGIGELDESGIPVSIDNYTRLNRLELLRYLNELDDLEFGEAPDVLRIRNLDEAAALVQRYVYDEEADSITDMLQGVVYYANGETGFFETVDGTTLSPGYTVNIGLKNFDRLFGSAAFRGPFVRVFIWTLLFSLFSVLTTFALGLLLALAFNDPDLPARRLIRSLLLIPYTIPGIIGVLIWRGLLNPHLGVLPITMEAIFGWFPAFMTDPFWSKVGILLVNLWLGYPYMMLVCTGALQSIPTDIYDAADVDGANAWQRFWSLTLPLLLVSVGPLLIASFTFNFNNFSVIYAYNEGRPPMAGTITPAGHTDILISYTYRVAFEGGGGSDYAYAAAITIVIFAIVVAITLFQYRYTRQWEEVSENV